MDGLFTVGHPAAVAAVHAMLASRVAHAILISGPGSVGKMSLALDIAAGLLCTGATGGDRPCRTCRTCRMVEHGNHPDLHRLGPSGSGWQIKIGDDLHPEAGSIRRLTADLSLLPVEGGERVAIVRDAQRMNDAAQSALLKTLEEPPARTTIILVTDDEEQLLPTVRSRSVRIRLGTVGPRAVEQLLLQQDLADAPTAARLARLTGGRAGIAVAYARSPEAVRLRGELSRSLLDMLGQGSSLRLPAAKVLLAQAMELAAALEPPAETALAPAAKGRSKGKAAPAVTRPAEDDEAPGEDGPAAEAETEGAAAKTPAAVRRKGLALLLEVWRDLTRDLAYVQRGAVRSVRDPALIEELHGAAAAVPQAAVSDALARLVRADELLAGNVSPELVLDVLLIRWPRRGRVA